MRVKGIDGKTHSWNLGQYVDSQHPNPSELHLRARNYFKDKWPAAQLLEEVYLPGESLYLDFYIPTFKLACECQGNQHNQHVPFFHKTKFDFIKAQSRDRRKVDWCKLNNIKLIFFFPQESEDEWDKKLNSAWTTNGQT
jgi:hypothetical protein